jgi:hypothetical protein
VLVGNLALRAGTSQFELPVRPTAAHPISAVSPQL